MRLLNVAAAFSAALLGAAGAQAQDRAVPQSRAQVQLSYAAVVKEAAPSVVNVYGARVERRQQNAAMEEFMRRFFGDGGPGGPGAPDGFQGRGQRSLGSGVVVDASGLVVTNHHVVEGMTEVKIALADKREFEATIVLSDPRTDLAVLKAKGAPPLHALEFGDSEGLQVGDLVLAIGNPFGVGQTVTHGIVSALARTQVGISDYQFFIQTDAAINPGNSGGPLVSVRGEVIGINSAIASETGFYSGYGFAIPINLARTVMNQLVETGSVHRAALGVSIDNVTLTDAEYVGLPEIRGVVVKDIPNEDSPARAAGILPGDVIVSVDNKPVERVGQLQQVIGFRKPGDVVKVEVARKGGVRKTFDVKLQALNDQPQVATAEEGDSDNSSAPGGTAMNPLGISVEPVTPSTAQQLQLPQGMKGLIVTDVTPGGPAWETLIDDPQRNGPDIILSIEGKPVRTEAELRNALKAEKAGSIVSLGIYNPRTQTRRVDRIRLGAK